MVEPYHPFMKRTPNGNDSLDNLCAVCGLSPMDPVHNPTPANYPPMKKAPEGDGPPEAPPQGKQPHSS